MRKFHLIMPIQALLCVVASLALSYPSDVAADAANISAAEAIHFVGQVVTVCGHVASVKYASDTKGQPTFLNLDKPYPNHVFTAVIWGKNRAAFSYAPESLAGRRICVSGTVQLYRERAEIAVSGPEQVKTAN
jgi:hypothetical protein